MKRKILLAGVIAVAMHSSVAYAQHVEYDPSLGTLPDAQGFTRLEDAGYPAPSVSSGLLSTTYLNNTTGDGQQNWYNATLPADFTQGTSVLEATLRIVNSDYKLVGPQQVSGFYLIFRDQIGRGFDIGISNTRVTINSDKDNFTTLGVSVSPFDTVSAFHDYRFKVEHGTGSLFIDNAFLASLPVGGMAYSAGSPLVMFGDASGHASSGVDLERFSASYSVPDATSSASLLGLAAASCFYLKRRHAKA